MEKVFGEATPDRIKLPAESGSIPELLLFITQQLKEVGLDEERICQIVTGIEEALLNTINHAAGEPGGDIEIKCDTHGDVFMIDIVDSCRPFNMLAATSFPEAFGDGSGKRPFSTDKLKRAIKNVEYRRDFKNGNNILACIVSK